MRNLLSFHKKPKWQPGANTIAYYPLTSTTTVNDMSGNNKNLTNYNNVPFGTYQGVNCASFNGSSQYLGLGAKFTLGNTYTVLSWYWHNTSNNGMVYCQGASSSLYPSLGLGYGVSSSNVSAHSGTGGNNTRLTSTVSSNNGKWVLGVFVFNNGTATIYENNTQTVSGSLSAPGTGGEDFYIGMRRQGYNYFSGLISNLIIENKARTAQEISEYYNQTKDNYGTSQSSPSSCFLAGTPVLVEGGSKPIDELNIGDTVLSYNKSTGEKEYNKVVDIIEHTETKDLLYTLDIEGQRIEATEFHKFYISDNKEDWRWEEIRNLKEGQWVFSIGGAKKINSVESKKFDGPCYNITVDNNHNYFVYDGILVHNSMSIN